MAPEQARQLVGWLLSLFVSVALPVGLAYGGITTSKADEIVIGIVTFAALLLLETSSQIHRIAAREKREEELWMLREACDTQLLNVSRCFVRLTREALGERDLFVAHFRKKIRELTEAISEVAERRQLRVRADHFLTVDNVLDAFIGDTERVWRYTWAIEGDAKLFDEFAWKRYFERTETMVESGNINEARTILVVDDVRAAQPPRVLKLLDFFHTNKGFAVRLMNREHFRTLCEDNSVPPTYIDFGIYGERLLFLTEQYEPEITGVFTKDPTEIHHYKNLFDSMWGSPSVARRNPSLATAHVTLEQLYEFDETLHT